MRRLVSLAVFALSVTANASARADQIHVVRSGEILGGIAATYAVSVGELQSWNRIQGDVIVPGQELRIRSRADGPQASAPATRPLSTYTVQPNDTLSAIAGRLSMTVDDLVALNAGLDRDRIRVGQELRVAATGRSTRRATYVVEAGDTVSAIAARHDVSVGEILTWNPGLDADRIRPGQEVMIVRPAPAVPSESIGGAARGRLLNAEPLPAHRAYTIRDPDRAFGTNETIAAIVGAFDHMDRRFEALPRVPVHDLSDRDGGAISDHRSHQSGRDVDIGYYQRGCRRDCVYQRFDPDDLDVEKQWALLSYWIERDLVEYVFMDHAIQAALVGWLRDRGESRANLRRWFQYPSGRGAPSGLIRHEPNHADHLHVRFRCPTGDEACL